MVRMLLVVSPTVRLGMRAITMLVGMGVASMAIRVVASAMVASMTAITVIVLVAGELINRSGIAVVLFMGPGFLSFVLLRAMIFGMLFPTNLGEAPAAEKEKQTYDNHSAETLDVFSRHFKRLCFFCRLMMMRHRISCSSSF